MLSHSSACTLDRVSVWRATRVPCHVYPALQGRVRQRARISPSARKMRRAPSLNSSRVTAATENDTDTALRTNSELRSNMSSSTQSKTKIQKSSWTVFGLQPSPELLSISMGKQHFASRAEPRLHAKVEHSVHVLLQCTLCKVSWDLLAWPSPFSTKTNSTWTLQL